MTSNSEAVAHAEEPPCSPCIQVCVLDAAGICAGCGRHIDEIAAWSRSTPQQQRSICEQAARRRERLPGSPQGQVSNYGKR